MMKYTMIVIICLQLMACGGADKKDNGNGQTMQPVAVASTSAGACGVNVFFKEGAEIGTSSYNGQDVLVSKQLSIVKKVYSEDGLLVSDLSMTNMDAEGKNEKIMSAKYKCDGKQLFIDLSGFLGEKGGKIETAGLYIPVSPVIGEHLPDANYSVLTVMGGKQMDIKSRVTERIVEAKEMITTPAGSFDCFRISSVIETDMNIPGMDEKSKQVMEAVKKKMGKNVMVFWYAPDITIVKMEFKMGDKLVTKSEITSIKK